MSTAPPAGTRPGEPERRYNLALFIALNEEYRDKPLVPRPPRHDKSSLEERGAARAARLAKLYRLSRLKVLEIGCGRGHVADALARDHGCAAVGVDVVRYAEWDGLGGGARFHAVDLSEPGADFAENGFDAIYSFAVWEHVTHPKTMLKRAFDLLKPGGRMHFSANLFRGPKASHRYREVFFPFPHLLFEDDVFEAFYTRSGRKPMRPAWINRLSAADYLAAVGEAGFGVETLSYATTPLDEAFYKRFEDVLARYPRDDLERDFINLDLVKPRR